MAYQCLFISTSPLQRITLLTLCTTFLLAPVPVSAEPVRYVCDLLVVKLRSDMEQPSPVVSTVRTGDRLEIIGQHPTGYVKVRTANDHEGWIAEKYLTEDLPKEIIINQLHKKITDLEQILERFTASPIPSATPPARHPIQPETGTVQQDNRRLRQRLAELSTHIDTLARQNIKLSLQLESTRRLPNPGQSARTAVQAPKNQRLTDRLADWDHSRVINGGIAGALVFIAGVIFGSLFFRKKRRLIF